MSDFNCDLCLVLPHLGAGGAQRVALMAAGHFASQGLRVSLITFLPGKPCAHRVPTGVDVIDLGPQVEARIRGDAWNRSLLARARRYVRIHARRLAGRLLLWSLWPWLQRAAKPGRNACPDRILAWSIAAMTGPQTVLLQRELQQVRPERVLAMLTRTNSLTCLALWSVPIHLVVSERNDPQRQPLSPLWRRLRDLLYQRADVVTANTAGVLEGLAGLPGASRVSLLPNPVPSSGTATPPDAASASEARSGFITVARLVPQKGIDLLLQAMADPAVEACGWPLQVLGDGPERVTLEAEVARLQLGDRVRFLGFQSDPLPYLAVAAVFVLPSRFEGMPNALLEAMAQGLAVIVTDASPGPLEVVTPGVTGLVVPREDPAALASAMATLAGDAPRRRRLGAAARERMAASDWSRLEPIWRSILALP